VDIDSNGFYPSLQLVTNPNDRKKMNGWTSMGTKKKQNDADVNRRDFLKKCRHEWR